jgi:hypothetical protein
MFLRVVLEVLPEVVGERVFGRHFGVEDGFEFRPVLGEVRELEVAPGFEADEEDALAVLRHHAPRVNDPVIDGVAEFLGERAVDDLEGAALIVPLEVLHVLQHEGGRLVEADDGGEVEEQVALLHVVEAVLAAEAELLGHARDAERLAGKAGAEDVELRDVGHGHGVDVAVRGFAEVGGVGNLGVLVPIAGEDALGARALEGDAEAANAAQEVNETRSAEFGRRNWRGVAGAVWDGFLVEGVVGIGGASSTSP